MSLKIDIQSQGQSVRWGGLPSPKCLPSGVEAALEHLVNLLALRRRHDGVKPGPTYVSSFDGLAEMPAEYSPRFGEVLRAAEAGDFAPAAAMAFEVDFTKCPPAVEPSPTGPVLHFGGPRHGLPYLGSPRRYLTDTDEPVPAGQRPGHRADYTLARIGPVYVHWTAWTAWRTYGQKAAWAAIDGEVAS